MPYYLIGYYKREINILNIGIIFGGKSFEHDISIITANTLYQILKENASTLKYFFGP